MAVSGMHDAVRVPVGNLKQVADGCWVAYAVTVTVFKALTGRHTGM